MVGGALLNLDGVLGFAGWQWVFLATGLPALLLAVVVLIVLPDGPAAARWLAPAQRDWLVRTLEAERQDGGLTEHGNPFAALLDRRVQMLACVYIAFPWRPTA